MLARPSTDASSRDHAAEIRADLVARRAHELVVVHVRRLDRGRHAAATHRVPLRMRRDVLAAHHREHPRVQLEPLLAHQRSMPAVRVGRARHENGVEAGRLQPGEPATPCVHVANLRFHPRPVLARVRGSRGAGGGTRICRLQRQRDGQRQTARECSEEFTPADHDRVSASTTIESAHNAASAGHAATVWKFAARAGPRCARTAAMCSASPTRRSPGAARNRTAPSYRLQHACFRHLVDDEIGAEQAERSADVKVGGTDRSDVGIRYLRAVPKLEQLSLQLGIGQQQRVRHLGPIERAQRFRSLSLQDRAIGCAAMATPPCA